jgi:Fe2+ transport system protein FeoA
MSPGNGGASAPRPAPMSAMRRGETARVVGLAPDLGLALCERLAALGFVPDAAVCCLRRAPLGSPTVYCVGETELCLRGDLASCVLVEHTA